MTDWDAATADALNDEPEKGSPEQEPTFPTPGPRPLELVVFGSSSWDDPFVVQAVLLAWAQHHAGHEVVMWTTDAPGGAEAEARIVGERSGWVVNQSTADGLLDLRMPPTATFAFVVPGTEAFDFAVDYAARRPVRRFIADTLTPNTRWARW